MLLWRCIFVIVVLLSLVLVFALTRSAPPNGHGVSHPQLKTMHQGGDAARHDELIWAGWLYGVLQLALFVATLILGLRRQRQGIGSIFAVGAALIVAFSLLMFVYAKHMHAASGDMILGYPMSTAVMLFVFWPLPALLIALYVVKFDRWILAAEDLAKLIDGKSSSLE